MLFYWPIIIILFIFLNKKVKSIMNLPNSIKPSQTNEPITGSSSSTAAYYILSNNIRND